MSSSSISTPNTHTDQAIEDAKMRIALGATSTWMFFVLYMSSGFAFLVELTTARFPIFSLGALLVFTVLTAVALLYTVVVTLDLHHRLVILYSKTQPTPIQIPALDYESDPQTGQFSG